MGSPQAIWSICEDASQRQGRSKAVMVYFYTQLHYICSAGALLCSYCCQSLCVLWLCIPSIVIPGMVLFSMTGFPGKVSKLSQL